MGDLSKNFSSKELCCRGENCCGHTLGVHPKLVFALQALRDQAGPITVTSAYRCAEHNARIGGAVNSQHVLGYAADVVIKSCISPGTVILTDREIHEYKKYGTLTKGLDEFQMVATIEEMFAASAKMFQAAVNIEDIRDGGIGLYYGRIHVDVREGGPARWDSRK